jgi:predicted  nucleic acid-binding Zn-ribbon protein
MVRRMMVLLALTAVVAALTGSSYGASKEIIELQEQMRALQNQVAKLQEEVHADMAVLKSNSNETSGNLKQMSDWAQKVDAAMKQQTADSDTCADQVSGSSIALRKQLQELQTRLDQIARNLQQENNRPASPPAAPPANPGGSSNPTP